MNKQNYQDILDKLSKSDFRKKFHLSEKDLSYIDSKGMDTIRKHACDFIASRISPADIKNDGKQTPMRGHPVFIAQHACACCCRRCLYKWHHIQEGRTLNKDEQDYIVNLIMIWIEKEYKNHLSLKS